MSFKGAVIAISGAGSGIGQETANMLSTLGADLSLADINFEAVDKLAVSLRAAGARAIAVQCDVRDSNLVNAWMEETRLAFGMLSGAVNCAGVFRKGITGDPIMAKTDEEWDFVIGINLTGMFHCLRAELGNMRRHGSVVNVTSVVGIIGLAMDAPYAVSKHGIIGLTRTAAKEMAEQGIRVNCVAPAATETPMIGSATERSRKMLLAEVKGHTPMARLATAQEVAKTICFLLSDDSSFTTGAVYTVDGGMTC